MYNNFEISIVVFKPNITTNHAITYTNHTSTGNPISLITSMITDRIGRHEVLLPINHNFNKICDM